MAVRKPFLLRIDPALLAELEAWAQDDLRSVNGQIEYVLQQAVRKRRRTGPRSGKSETNPKGTHKQEAGTIPSQLATHTEGSSTSPPSSESPPGPPDSPDEPQGQTA